MESGINTLYNRCLIAKADLKVFTFVLRGHIFAVPPVKMTAITIQMSM